MTSNLMESCCYQGFNHHAEPRGSISIVEDIEVYTIYPQDRSTEYGLLILTDIIGHRFTNAQVIADQFADHGYFVMMPDLFYGDAVPLNKPGEFDMAKWRNGDYHPQGKNHLPETVDPIVERCVSEMLTKYRCKKIGAVGYCFGGKYVVRHLVPGRVDVGFTAHPSHIDESELKDIQGPLAIAAAEHDKIFPAEKRHATEEILRETGLPYQVNLYSGVSHGFGVRGDPTKREVQFAMRSAFFQAVEWFNHYMKEQ
ncbi:hypothetical protein N7540_004882 [Penicillium herquei]|nr:hypothetical protein N7540_004882 [Penicillium herquei]